MHSQVNASVFTALLQYKPQAIHIHFRKKMSVYSPREILLKLSNYLAIYDMWNIPVLFPPPGEHFRKKKCLYMFLEKFCLKLSNYLAIYDM